MKKHNNNHDRMSHEDDRMHPMMRNRPFLHKKLMGHDSFKSMKSLILLTKIEEETEGISGYQLQEHFDLPRGTLLRMLSELKENKKLKTQNIVKEGRANKYYSLTQDGEDYLEELRIQWADRNAEIDDLAPFENYGMRHFQRDMYRRGRMNPPRRDTFKGQDHPPHPHRRHPPRHSGVHPHRPGRHLTKDDILEILINRRDTIKSKEEAIDFLKGHRSRLTSTINRLKSRVQETQIALKEIDDLVDRIGKLDEFSDEKLEKLFTDPPTE
ncbi:MAG: hypothetical protein ACTSVZ_03600 [Promethearchaeota archaeon]